MVSKNPGIVEMRTDPKGARREINRLNRQRAKQMETRISKLFLGTTKGKTAQSGAGMWQKGDCDVPLPNDSGKLLIECKCSSAINGTFGATLPIQYSWFDKMEREKIAMGSRLAVLCIHYHNFTGDYVLFREIDIPIIEAIAGTTYTFAGPIVDGTHNKSGKKQVTDHIHRVWVLDAFRQTENDSAPNMRYQTHGGLYVLVDAREMKRILGYEQ